MSDFGTPDGVREFSELTAELSSLVKEWEGLTPAERAEQLERFRGWHHDIASRMARPPKPWK